MEQIVQLIERCEWDTGETCATCGTWVVVVAEPGEPACVQCDCGRTEAIAGGLAA